MKALSAWSNMLSMPLWNGKPARKMVAMTGCSRIVLICLTPKGVVTSSSSYSKDLLIS